MRAAKRIAIALVALYAVFLGAIYALMSGPPERFASAIAHMPGSLFLVLPFETLWSHARAGSLASGTEAPDFHLGTLDKKSEVSLSTLRGKQPVVLVFGSYT